MEDNIFKDLPVVPGKSPERVPKFYLKWPSEWKAQYNMLLMDGKKCGDCNHSEGCKMIFGGNDANDRCQFYPSRFHQRQVSQIPQKNS